MTRQWSPWTVPTRSREDNGSWTFSFTRESEAMDLYVIPVDRTEALAAALGVSIDVLVEQLHGEKAKPALVDAWKALVGNERDEGIARLERAGRAPRSAGSWTPFGDYGVYDAPVADSAPEGR